MRLVFIGIEFQQCLLELDFFLDDFPFFWVNVGSFIESSENDRFASLTLFELDIIESSLPLTFLIDPTNSGPFDKLFFFAL